MCLVGGRPSPSKQNESCFLSSHASKMQSFFLFRKLGRLLFGEPLGGVGAPTVGVGADLCVRPSSPERSLFCGRTHRSAPTQATSARQFHSSNAVTLNGDGRPPASHDRAFLLLLLLTLGLMRPKSLQIDIAPSLSPLTTAYPDSGGRCP